jgi:hypothetical protein
MKTLSIYFVIVTFSLAIAAKGEVSPETELVDSIRASYKVSVDRYLDAKRIPLDPAVTPSKVIAAAIEEQLTKLELDLNARDLNGDDVGSRAYNRIADQKRRRAEEKINLIRAAKDSDDKELLEKEAIESLEEDLRLAHVRLISYVAMLIEDDPDGREPMTHDQNLDIRVREYWAVKNRLDVLKDPKPKTK